ncbi:MAG TPA: YbjN domain-containing protein [Candidatus Limnocylindrales bacterium]|nr:YbjN domain-containing protein [Candidatus Limnocylindrales bacterium]
MTGRARDEPGWDELEVRLASALERLRPETFLVLSVAGRPKGGTAPYVQFLNFGPPGLRVEASSNRYLAPAHELSPDREERLGRLGWQWPLDAGEDDRNFHREWPNPAPWAEIASLAVRTLRDVFDVEAPARLRYLHRAAPAFEGRLPRLDLGIPAERSPRPRDDDDGQGPSPALVLLNRRLEDALKSFLGLPDLIRDADDDIPVRVGSVLMYVRAVAGTPPLVQLFAPVLDDVELTLPLLETINEVNRRVLFGRLFWGHRGVIVAMELTGVDLTHEQVAFACVQLGNLADALGTELAARFGPPDADRPKRPLVN